MQLHWEEITQKRVKVRWMHVFYCSLLHDKSKEEDGNIVHTFPGNILNCWDKYMQTKTAYTCSMCNAYTTCVKCILMDFMKALKQLNDDIFFQ